MLFLPVFPLPIQRQTLSTQTPEEYTTLTSFSLPLSPSYQSHHTSEKYVWSATLTMPRSRHMCGQWHRPNYVHSRFFDGRQAIVQGSGGEETVRNQEGAINWVITHCMSLSSIRHFQCRHSSSCSQTNINNRRGGWLDDTGLPDTPASKRSNVFFGATRSRCNLIYVIQIMIQRSTLITKLTDVCRNDKRFNIKISSKYVSHLPIKLLRPLTSQSVTGINSNVILAHHTRSDFFHYI